MHALSKLTIKFQASIPKEVREKLKLKAGDYIEFEEMGGEIVVKKSATALDKAFLKMQAKSLEEWNNDIDNQQFDYLTNLVK